MNEMFIKRSAVFLFLIGATLITQAQSSLERSFKKVPDSIQTSVYWYWFSDNISKAGVVKDLQAMKKAGINRAFIGNIGIDDLPYGKVELLSDEWWDIMYTALKTAGKSVAGFGFDGPCTY